MRLCLAVGLALTSCRASTDAADQADGATTGTSGSTTTGSASPADMSDGMAGGDDGDGAVTGCTSLGFCMPDGGGVRFECDLFTQDCEPGDKCMPWANDGGSTWNATRCSPLAEDPGQRGEPCTVVGTGVSGIDDCDVGLMCWHLDDRWAGVCEDMCRGSADAPICDVHGETCMLTNDGALALCLPPCDPLVQDCPLPNEACYAVGAEWACAPDVSQSAGTHGDMCLSFNDCDLGLVCVDLQAFGSCNTELGCCTTVCDLADPDADATCQALDPTHTCVAWYPDGMAPVGYETVGACLLEG